MDSTIFLDDNNRCSICGIKSSFHMADIYLVKTAYSETPVNEILERLFSTTSVDLTEEYKDIVHKRSACQECLIKIDEYDLAYTNAVKAENYLINIIKSKEKKIQNENNTAVITFKIEETQQVKDEFLIENYDDSTESNFESKNGFDDYNESNEDTDKFFGNCKKCNVKFKSIDEFAYHEHHLTIVKPNPSKQIQIQGNYKLTKRIQCSQCPETFMHNTSYRLHLRQHLKQNSLPFKCETCEKSFSNYPLLDIHRNIHMDKSELECRYCSKVFTTKNSASKHNRLHSKQYEYQCERCGKQFIHHTSFRMHKFAHDDIRTVSCKLCHRLFRCMPHLNRHMRTHTGEKPFKCDHCERTFAQRFNMEQHRKRHYPEEKSFKCSNCQKSFCTRKELDSHLKDSHNEEFLSKQRFYARKTRTAVYEYQDTQLQEHEYQNGMMISSDTIKEDEQIYQVIHDDLNIETSIIEEEVCST